VSEESRQKNGSSSEEPSPPGEETMNGATGRYDLPGEGSGGELLAKQIREASIKTFKAGDYLFHAGQEATCFWMIVSGKVAQYKGATRINELGARRFLGMRTFMLPGKFETTAQVTEPGKIIELDLAFLKEFFKLPDAVLAFLKEEELEIHRLAEAGRRREILLSSTKQEVARLQEQLRRDAKAAPGNGVAGAVLVLQQVKSEIDRASQALDELARNESALWKSLQDSEVFVQLFLTVKNVAEKVGGMDLSSRASRHE